jgi:hypothetical protein
MHPWSRSPDGPGDTRHTAWRGRVDVQSVQRDRRVMPTVRPGRFNDLGNGLVPQNELRFAIWWRTILECANLAIRAANADLDCPQHHIGATTEPGRRAVSDADGPTFRIDQNGAHTSAARARPAAQGCVQVG